MMIDKHFCAVIEVNDFSSAYRTVSIACEDSVLRGLILSSFMTFLPAESSKISQA